MEEEAPEGFEEDDLEEEVLELPDGDLEEDEGEDGLKFNPGTWILLKSNWGMVEAPVFEEVNGGGGGGTEKPKPPPEDVKEEDPDCFDLDVA